MKRRTTRKEVREAERFIRCFVADHPLLNSTLPDERKAEIIIGDALQYHRELVEKWTDALAIERLTGLVEAVQNGDQAKAMTMLQPFPEDVAIELLDAIGRVLMKRKAAK